MVLVIFVDVDNAVLMMFMALQNLQCRCSLSRDDRDLIFWFTFTKATTTNWKRPLKVYTNIRTTKHHSNSQMIRLQADNDDGDQVQFSWSVIPQQVPDGGEAASEVYYWGYSGIQPRKRV